MALWAGLPACWPRENSRKLRSEPLWGLGIAAPDPQALREASRRLKSAPGGLKTAQRALRQASRRPQERSGRLQDGSKSAPGGLKTASTALRQARDGFKSALGGLKTASRAFQEAQDVFPRAHWEVSRRPDRRSSSSKWEFPREHQRSFSKLLREFHQAYLSCFGIFESAPRHPKWAFEDTFKEAVQVHSARVHGSTSPRVHGTTGPRDHGSTSPRVHGTTGARDHGSTGPRVHEPTGPRVHGSMRCLGKTTQPLRSC